MSIENLALSYLWWYGQENMKCDNEVPVKTDIERSPEVHKEKVNEVVMKSSVIQSDTQSLWRLNSNHHSSWKRLLFITNAKRSVDRKIVDELLPSEIKETEDWFIKST